MIKVNPFTSLFKQFLCKNTYSTVIYCLSTNLTTIHNALTTLPQKMVSLTWFIFQSMLKLTEVGLPAAFSWSLFWWQTSHCRTETCYCCKDNIETKQRIISLTHHVNSVTLWTQINGKKHWVWKNLHRNGNWFNSLNSEVLYSFKWRRKLPFLRKSSS